MGNTQRGSSEPTARLARRRNAMTMLNVDQGELDRLRDLYENTTLGNVPLASRQGSDGLQLDLGSDDDDNDDDIVFISSSAHVGHPPSEVVNSPVFRRRRNGQANVLDSLSDDDIEYLQMNHHTNNRRNGYVY